MAQERRLHILGSIRGRLQMTQIDAIELACLDTWFTPVETDDVTETLIRLRKNATEMVLVDPPTLICLMSDHNFVPNAQVILVVFERENPQLAEHVERLRGLRYLVGAHTPSMMRGVLGAILEHQACGEVRGLVARLMTVEKQTALTLRLNDSSQRARMQDDVIEFFRQEIEKHSDEMVSGIGNFPKNLGDVLEELLMNAIWDAHPDRARVDRTQSVELPEEETVVVDARCDGLNLSLSVQDVHGSFPQKAMFKPVKFALGFREEAAISQDTAGAGIGLYMTIQRLTALSFEVEAGKLTRVSAILRGDQSLRDTQRKPRTILFFEKHASE